MMVCEPKRGWSDEPRSEVKLALGMRHIVQSNPVAVVIRVVFDNLNTHKATSLYVAFPPEEACVIARKIEIHYTPSMASGCNSGRSHPVIMILGVTGSRPVRPRHLIPKNFY